MQACLRCAAVPTSVPSSVYAKHDPAEERSLAANPNPADFSDHRLACTLNRAFIMRESMEQRWTSNNARRVNWRKTEGEQTTQGLTKHGFRRSAVDRSKNLF